MDRQKNKQEYTPSSLPEEQQKLRCMVVEDEDSIRELIVTFLETTKKFETFEASNPIDALNLIEKLGYIDCVLSDINMPGMDGLEFISRLKKKDRSVEAVIITGYPSMEAIIEAMRAGSSDFIVKPFTIDQLRWTVDKMYRDRRSFLEESMLTGEEKSSKALELANLKLEKKIRELSILFNVSDELNKAHSKRELYAKIVHLATSLTEKSRVSFWELNQHKDKLVLMSAQGELARPGIREINLQAEYYPFVQVVRDGVTWIAKSEKSGSTPFKRTANPFFEGLSALVPFTRRGVVYGVLVVCNKKEEDSLGDDYIFLLHLLADRANLTAENLFLYESLSISLRSTLRALVRSLEARDPYTKEHSERVANLSVKLASCFGIGKEVQDSLSFAAHLHDIGKIGIRDNVLMKPVKLTTSEFDMIKLHPVIGEEIISHLDVEPIIKSCIRNHHERWDGKGYPDGLSGENIPFLVRILTVADCYDAITSKRPYRDLNTSEVAVNEIRKGSGSHFDPQVVEVFLDYMRKKSI
jgi:response regulator RpfG family c-di-GMP phosphodiesterase